MAKGKDEGGEEEETKLEGKFARVIKVLGRTGSRGALGGLRTQIPAVIGSLSRHWAVAVRPEIARPPGLTGEPREQQLNLQPKNRQRHNCNPIKKNLSNFRSNKECSNLVPLC